jgi:hypothetical protein
MSSRVEGITSYEAALGFLENNYNPVTKKYNVTQAELTELVGQVSAEASDSKVTVLYSGGIELDSSGSIISYDDGGKQAWEVSVIGQTDVAILLDSTSFKNALRGTVDTDAEFDSKVSDLLEDVINSVTLDGFEFEGVFSSDINGLDAVIYGTGLDGDDELYGFAGADYLDGSILLDRNQNVIIRAINSIPAQKDVEVFFDVKDVRI